MQKEEARKKEEVNEDDSHQHHLSTDHEWDDLLM